MTRPPAAPARAKPAVRHGGRRRTLRRLQAVEQVRAVSRSETPCRAASLRAGSGAHAGAQPGARMPCAHGGGQTRSRGHGPAIASSPSANSIIRNRDGRPRGRNAPLPHTRYTEQLRYGGNLQHPTHGRVLRLAARLQAAVRRPFDPPRLPAGRGGPDQRRRLPRATADPRAARIRSCSNSRKLPGKVTAGGAAGVNPKDYDLVGLAMQEPQYRSPGVRELLDAVAKSRVPCMSIMNMPPLPYVKRIPGLDYDGAEARLHRPDRVGQLRSQDADAQQPGPAGDPSARREGQRADGHAADQLQGRAVRGREVHRDPAPAARRTSRRCASTRRRARSSCR